MLLRDLTRVTRHFPLEVTHRGAYCTNPSVILSGQRLVVTLKAIYNDTYRAWRSGDHNITREGILSGNRVRKEVLIAESHDQLRIDRVREIDTSDLLSVTKPRYLKSKALADASAEFTCCVEDLRLFNHNEHLMVMGSYIEYAFVQLSDDYCFIVNTNHQTFIARLIDERLTSPLLMPSLVGAPQDKNWIIHQPNGDRVKICTNVQTRAMIEVDLKKQQYDKNIDSEPEDFRWDGGWSGSTALVPFQGQFLGILHRKCGHLPVYEHIFFLCDAEFRITCISEPFSFSDCAVEFCCGLTKDDSRGSFLISFSTWDRTAGVFAISEDSLASAIKRKINCNSDLLAEQSNERTYYKNHFNELLECVEERSKTIASLRRYLAGNEKWSPNLSQLQLDNTSTDDVDARIDVIIQTIEKYDRTIRLMKHELRWSF